LAGVVTGVAHELGIKIRWGGDWDQDGEWKDERFVDMPHYELLTAGSGDQK
jgi:peptidoglycan L-alanyl-D-glutamate endopeptidase CwlK